MPNSLFTAVTGLRVHQQMLDVIGNNLANTNTVAFKEQSVRFSDLVYQTVNQATNASSNNIGGTNPVQIGLGVKVAAVAPNLQQGSLESTGRDLDLAIQGDGYFVASNGAQDVYTRAGSFAVDSDNYLVDPANGFRVQRFGTVGEGGGNNPVFQTPGTGAVQIPIGTGIPGKSTTLVHLQGNLTAAAIGPRAQTLTTGQPMLSGGVPATLATLINGLTDNSVDYVAGDQLHLIGTSATNVPVNVSIPVGPGTTVGDLINAINANFPGSTATLNAQGNLIVTANSTGPNNLTVSINEQLGNTGYTSWGNHNFAVTTLGKDGDVVKTGIQIFDVQGSAHNLDLVFQKQSENVWDLKGSIDPKDGIMTDSLAAEVRFNDDGSFRQATGTGVGDAFFSIQFAGLSQAQQLTFDFGTGNGFDGLTQVGGNSSAVATGQDGFGAGFLTSLSIGQDGIINGIFTNGRTLPVAQLAIAKFANPAALNRVGDNYYGLTSESGPALLGTGLSGGRGSILQKQLESSNVDVALEFTRLIIAQRGFQVNARVITASDQVLQELANILR